MKLLEAITLAAHVAERNATLPALAHLKVSGGRILATDLMQQIDVPAALPSGLAEVCVHGARILKVLKAVPEDAEIDLRTEGTRLIIIAGRTRYELNTLPAADFPAITPSPEDSVDIAVPAKDLVAALKFVAPAMAVNDTRYYLNGAHIQFEPSGIILTATDGHRLHRARLAIEPHDGPAIAGIVGNTSIARVIEIAGRHKDVTLSLSGTHFAIEDDEHLLVKLVDGHFPDADRVIPSATPATAGVPRAEFLAAVKRVNAIAPQGLRLGFDTEIIAISAANADGESAAERFDWNTSGAKVKRFEMGIDPNLLIPALEAFTCERVNLHLGHSAEAPLYLTDDGDGSREVVVMGMRL